MNKKIIFTGGGSAGHVTLNLTLIPLFLAQGWKVCYVGSYKGIERDLIGRLPEVKYYPIATGKLRRYFSWQNFLDILKIPLGVLQAVWIVFKEKPKIVFSKGGFVSFPVVLAGKVNGCPVVMHESDVTPGLANRMSLPFVTKFFTTFSDTVNYVKNKEKVENIGPVLSDRFKNGSKARCCVFCEFAADRPIVLAMGGSLGAQSLNQAIRNNLPELLQSYQIIHICGRGQKEEGADCKGYRQFEYVEDELKDFMKAADVVISRAGSNAIFELRSLNKPMILVPLSSVSSRGEQMLNAKSFHAKGYCEIIADEELTDSAKLLNVLKKVYDNRKQYEKRMSADKFRATTTDVLAEKIMNLAKKQTGL